MDRPWFHFQPPVPLTHHRDFFFFFSIPWAHILQLASVQRPCKDSSTGKNSPFLPLGCREVATGQPTRSMTSVFAALTVFELRLIYQYLLWRVSGTEQVPGTLADRLPSPEAFFI